MCIPFNVVELKYKDGIIRKHQFGTFSYIVMTLMFRAFRSRMEKNVNEHNNYNNMISILIHVRNSYFQKNKLNQLSISPYKEYGVQCSGKTISFDRKYILRRIKKKNVNKNPIFTYNPNGNNEVPKKKYIFSNTSGNLIIKEMNNKVNVNKKYEKEDDSDDEEIHEELQEGMKDETDKSNEKIRNFSIDEQDNLYNAILSFNKY